MFLDMALAYEYYKSENRPAFDRIISNTVSINVELIELHNSELMVPSDASFDARG